jgi:NADH-quinone oxidoreductase subunit B
VVVVEVAGIRLGVEPVNLACCAVEVAEAVRGVGGPGPGEPVDAYVLLVAGTVTRANAGSVRARYDATPEPRFVVAYGACATSGGPYWDSYAVVPGVGELLPVDVVVPGCPPPPAAVAAALDDLGRALAADPSRLVRNPP